MNTDSLRHRLNKDEINALPQFQYDGPVHLVCTPEELAAALPPLRAAKLLGFDTETRPSFRKGRQNAPALLQLATRNAVYLIRLSILPFDRQLAAILANPTQIKTGVAIRDDMCSLAKLYDFEPAGLTDLGGVARAHKLPCQGLRTIAAQFFGWRISKGSQCSNWERSQLTPQQIAYAATDAWIGRLIFLRMCALGFIPMQPGEPDGELPNDD